MIKPDIIGRKVKKSLKKMKEFLFGNKKRIIYFSAVVVSLVVVAAALLYFYFYIYLEPNFNDAVFNNVITENGDIVKPGDKITYTINYKNTGFRLVDNLEIKTKIPENTIFVSASRGAVFNDENHIISLSVKNIDRGSSGNLSFMVEVIKPLDSGTKIVLDEVLFNYLIGDEQFNRIISGRKTMEVESNPEFTDFNLTSDDLNGGHLGFDDEIIYRVNIKNGGDMNAEDVQLRSELSENVKVIEDSITQSGKYDGNNIIWNIENLEIGKSKTFTFIAAVINEKLQDGDPVTNKTTLTYSQEIVDEKSTNDLITLFPDFSESEVLLSNINGWYLWSGETIGVKLVIKNTGERTAKDYKLICPIPGGATYISKSGNPEGISWSDEIRGLIWDLTDLEIGEQKEIKFSMVVNDDLFYKGGTITTSFKIESSGIETELPSKSIGVKGRVCMNIVAMGDSLIAKSDWVQRFDSLLEAAYPYADYNTIASAVNGENSFQGLARFDSTVVPHHPHIIILAYGTNDAGYSLSYFASSMEQMVIKSRNLGATVFLNLIGPVYYPGKESYSQYNSEILKIALKYSLPVIDVLSPLSQNPGKYLYDGVHYTPEGAAVVAQTAYNQVIKYLNDIGGRR